MICNKCNHKLPDDSEFCQYCGNKLELGSVDSIDKIEKPEESYIKDIPDTSNIEIKPAFDGTKLEKPPKINIKTAKIKNIRKTAPSNKLICFTNISSIILTIISILSIIIAMNIQDARRNSWEYWSPTVVYIILILVLGVLLTFAIISLIKKRFKLLLCLSFAPFITMVVTSLEGSILSSYNFNYERLYKNSEVVDTFNVIWIMCVILILIITLIPVIVATIKKINYNWHQSISYREKCYKRVAKIHSYLDKGIITKEEYEKTKNDILRYIE